MASAYAHTSLNVIGLISGGKDSFFSLLHCLANNHRVIALANLYPPGVTPSSSTSSDLNSYMYQTAGHGLIPLYADALGLPLYRQEISGSVRDPSKDYQYASGEDTGADWQGGHALGPDETESLLPLLRKVVGQHPSADALCSGAILSTYQRTRIESVARRLNLVPLSYLWQYPSLPPPSPGGLLDDMKAVGFDVRIVKVASGGLDEGLLWENLMDRKVRAKVEKSAGRFGGSVLGEGGEYETLVVDGPMPMWKGRVEAQYAERLVGRGGGGEAYLEFSQGKGRVVTKEAGSELEWRNRLRKIGLWDAEFRLLLDGLKTHPIVNALIPDERRGRKPPSEQKGWEARPIIFRHGPTLKISNITSAGSGFDVREQMLGISSSLLKILAEDPGSSPDDIVFTTILLRSMADFASLNSAYERLFAKPNPPARVAMACGDALPVGVSVMVTVVVDLGDRSAREGLHVQSRSYWAPANIGPYSQAISVPLSQEKDPFLVYVAGQIPLVPASMEALQAEDDDTNKSMSNFGLKLFQKRTCLALQHLWRIGSAMGVGWWTGGVAFILGQQDVQIKAMVACEIWKRAHQRGLWEKVEEQEDGLDVWDRTYGGMGNLVKAEAGSRSLPDFAAMPDLEDPGVPGFLAVQVDELPRGCDVEWQSLGVSHHTNNTVLQFEIPLLESDQAFCTKISGILDDARPDKGFQATVYTPLAALISDLDVQIVPCRAVLGPKGVQLMAGVVIQKFAIEG
ncbi:hypothetical protein MMC28_005920 [Mycoblastus sanguinarius]|nr:hypothetical protein [Mycoblastus sanguinarius]